MVANGQTMPLGTGDYDLKGKSRGASTAKRTIGGAAVGTIIGVIAGAAKVAGLAQAWVVALAQDRKSLTNETR